MLQAKSKKESYSLFAGNNIAVPNPGSEGASSVFPPTNGTGRAEKVFADQKENQHLFYSQRRKSENRGSKASLDQGGVLSCDLAYMRVPYLLLPRFVYKLPHM